MTIASGSRSRAFSIHSLPLPYFTLADSFTLGDFDPDYGAAGDLNDWARARVPTFEGGQDYFLDMFVLIWPSSRPRKLSTEVERGAVRDACILPHKGPGPSHVQDCRDSSIVITLSCKSIRQDFRHTSPYPVPAKAN